MERCAASAEWLIVLCTPALTTHTFAALILLHLQPGVRWPQVSHLLAEVRAEWVPGPRKVKKIPLRRSPRMHPRGSATM
ncbi:uncharacterized protein B0T15DRAFT_515697 [Chaetomium strumarium]|uniref:Uncharacterized protein n=1 Tax=Chaetomium strumarium TaxID=1170767 RepID=A0AAJ0H0D5_9PEZI|nr:hypothetical protein B0T15DRAFT_515697 [Chaetomium strumarium]